MTLTDGLPPESRDGNVVVVTAKLIGRHGTWTTGLTFPCWVGIGRPIARLDVARPGVQECYLVALQHVQIWHSDLL